MTKPWLCVEIKTNAMWRTEQILSECSVHPITCHEGTEEKWRYSYTLSLTLALDGGGWSMLCPGLFTPRKDPVPIVQEAGWAPGPVWKGAENLASTGIRSPDFPAHSESLYRLSYPGPLPGMVLPEIRNEWCVLC